jgi:hypothetical protein
MATLAIVAEPLMVEKDEKRQIDSWLNPVSTEDDAFGKLFLVNGIILLVLNKSSKRVDIVLNPCWSWSDFRHFNLVLVLILQRHSHRIHTFAVFAYLSLTRSVGKNFVAMTP